MREEGPCEHAGAASQYPVGLDRRKSFIYGEY